MIFINLVFFAASRYFEEFEKRIPRAEMEKMEVIKHLHFFSPQKEYVFSVMLCTLVQVLEPFPFI